EVIFNVPVSVPAADLLQVNTTVQVLVPTRNVLPIKMLSAGTSPTTQVLPVSDTSGRVPLRPMLDMVSGSPVSLLRTRVLVTGTDDVFAITIAATGGIKWSNPEIVV